MSVLTDQRTTSPPVALGNAARSGRLVEVQWLRAAAAALVVFQHARDLFEPAGVRDIFPKASGSLGAWGVDIFFIISGFIIARTAWSRRGPRYPAAEFARRRWARIAPPYWFWSAIAFAWLTLRATGFSGRAILKTITFVPIFDGKEFVLPILFVGWTLAYEAAFYGVVSITLACGAKTVRPALIIAGLFGLASLSSPPGPILQFWLNPLWLEFAAGMGIAVALSAIKRIPRFAAGALVLLALGFWLGSAKWSSPSLGECLLILDHTLAWSRLWAWGIPAAVLVAGILALGSEILPAAMSQLGERMGNASYSWYLTQLISLPFLSRIWRTFVRFDSALGFLLFALVGSGVFAIAAWRFAEEPLCAVGLKIATRLGGGASREHEVPVVP